MKAISLWQPWASLMAKGLKKNETRSWSTSYRGPLLIHAAKRKPNKDNIDWLWSKLFDYGYSLDLWDIPSGAILCQVDLMKCVEIDYINCPYEGALEYQLGNYNPGRYMWITDHLISFKIPIPYRGQQGIFNIPDEIIENELSTN